MAARMIGIALAMGTIVLSPSAAAATEPVPVVTGDAAPTLPAETDEGPMVAPVKRMRPEMPASKSKNVAPEVKAASDAPAKPVTKQK